MELLQIYGFDFIPLTTSATTTTQVPVTTTTPPSTNCNGIPTTDWSCCSSFNQCNVGEGDCDVDYQCKGNLRCGNNNCKAIGITGSNWYDSADCCEGMLISNFNYVSFNII